MLTPQLAKFTKLSDRLDSLGDNSKLKDVRQRGDCLDDRAVLSALIDSPHQLTGNLQSVRRQLGEIAQR